MVDGLDEPEPTERPSTFWIVSDAVHSARRGLSA